MNLERLNHTDALLDAVGGRRRPSGDDEMISALYAWVEQIDAVPVRSAGPGAHRAPRKRRLRRVIGGGAIVLVTVTGSSVAAALTGSDVPALSSLGRAVVDWVPLDGLTAQVDRPVDGFGDAESGTTPSGAGDSSGAGTTGELAVPQAAADAQTPWSRSTGTGPGAPSAAEAARGAAPGLAAGDHGSAVERGRGLGRVDVAYGHMPPAQRLEAVFADLPFAQPEYVGRHRAPDVVAGHGVVVPPGHLHQEHRGAGEGPPAHAVAAGRVRHAATVGPPVHAMGASLATGGEETGLRLSATAGPPAHATTTGPPSHANAGGPKKEVAVPPVETTTGPGETTTGSSTPPETTAPESPAPEVTEPEAAAPVESPVLTPAEPLDDLRVPGEPAPAPGGGGDAPADAEQLPAQPDQEPDTAPTP